MGVDRLHCGNCLEIMPSIADKSVDMVLCDMPYGLTACAWDVSIPFEPMWEQLERIVKDTGLIVLTASQPFTSKLVMSNLKMFKYECIWEKHQGTNPMSAKIAPLKAHENILVFSKGRTTYNPQMGTGKPYSSFKSTRKQSVLYSNGISIHRDNKEGSRYPKTVVRYTKDKGKRTHPTQKPVALFEYLIRTYTNEGDLVLDMCAGSFTTAIVADNSKRNWICIEKEAKYCEIGRKRIEENKKRIGRE